MNAREILEIKVASLSSLSPGDIDLGLAEAEQYVKTYCHRRDIPADLAFTVANLAADILRAQHPESSAAFSMAEVGSISVGDVSVQRNPEFVKKSVPLSETVLSYHDILNKFRKIAWEP